MSLPQLPPLSGDGRRYDPVPVTSDMPSPGLHRPPQYDPYNDGSMPNTPRGGTPNLPGDVLGQPHPHFLGAGQRGSYADSDYTYRNDSATDVGGSMANLPKDVPSGAFDPYRDDPHADSSIPMAAYGQGSNEKPMMPPPRKSRKGLYAVVAVVAALLLVTAVAVPVVLTTRHKSSGAAASAGSSGSGSDGGGSDGGDGGKGDSGGKNNNLAVTGGDGSTVTTDDGSTFTYSNKFGGSWYYDQNDPFNNAARPQSWSPPLNESFKWGTDIIRGVNIGGWLVTEPFIVPALYEKYPTAVDEYTLSQAMRNDTSGGGIQQLEDHYKTFITEQDFAEIAAAGLNFVRIPIPYWTIETRGDEPFLAKTSWTYFMKAVKWARKYGLRINMDLHALPGGQNPWNHSGRMGPIAMLNGPMGYANAQRSLDYIRILAEFIAQPEYSDVVVMFGITNEPQEVVLGQENLQRYYLQAYNTVRGVTNFEVGKGPLVSFHNGFLPDSAWAGFLPGADRIALDNHPYLAFSGQDPDPLSKQTQRPCLWGADMNTSMDAFGMTAAGEFSNAANDCGKWVNGVGNNAGYEGAVGSCDPWTNWPAWDDDMKTAMKQFSMASMDALQNWFFWTWKIGNSTVTGKVESPAWTYQLGLQNGWMPTDPREAIGACGGTQPWSGTLTSGNGQIAASQTEAFAWPPTTIANAGPVTALPSYTPTGTVATLTAPTVSASGTSIDVGNGWFDASDTAGAMVAIATCNYVDTWAASTVELPSPLCSGAARREAVPPEPQITSAPA